MGKPSILIVDDEANIRSALQRWFQICGFDVFLASDGAEAVALCESNRFDVITMDLEMPRMGGIQALTEIRKKHPDVPVLIVTPRSSAEIDSLNDGADGFLRKPIEPNVLVAHVNALLRRRAGSTDSHFRFGAWRIDLEGSILRNPDGEIESLTRGEFKLLALLVQAQGRIVSRELLSEAANRGHRHGDEFGDLRSVDALVSRLRRKLGSDIIGTAPGFGYRLAAKVGRA